MNLLEALAQQRNHLDAGAVTETIGALSTRRLLVANFSATVGGLEMGRENVPMRSGNNLTAGIKLAQELSPTGDLVEGSAIKEAVARLVYIRPDGLRRLGRITAAVTLDVALDHYSTYAADLFEDDLRGVHEPTVLTERIGVRELRELQTMAADLSDADAAEASRLWVGRLTRKEVAETVEAGVRSAKELPAWVSKDDLAGMEAVAVPYETDLSATGHFNVGLVQMLNTADMAMAGA